MFIGSYCCWKILFESKFLSDFANSVEKDASQCSFKCTTHVKSLRCDLKLDGKCRIVTISGVRRIVWKKDFVPKITRAIFKQYVQLSETENNTCAQQMRERSTYGENPAITSTPLVGRTDFHLNSYSNNVHQPNFNCTPIVQSGSVQTYSDRINAHPSYTPAMQRQELQSVSNGVNAQQSI